MTVAECIDWLKTQPQDATVEVVTTLSQSHSAVDTVDFDPADADTWHLYVYASRSALTLGHA